MVLTIKKWHAQMEHPVEVMLIWLSFNPVKTSMKYIMVCNEWSLATSVSFWESGKFRLQLKIFEPVKKDGMNQKKIGA